MAGLVGIGARAQVLSHHEMLFTRLVHGSPAKSTEYARTDNVKDFPLCYYSYHLFQQCAEDHGSRSRLCEHYKDTLMDECNAVWDGTTLTVPNKSRYEIKTKWLLQQKMMKEEATKAGFKTVLDYCAHKIYEDASHCRFISKQLQECLSMHGDKGKTRCEFWRERMDLCEAAMENSSR